MTPQDPKSIEDAIRHSLLAEVSAFERSDGFVQVETPFEFGDGDAFQLFVKPMGLSGFRLTDRGTTLMHLSYEMDLERLREGARARLMERITHETGLSEDDGEFFIDLPADDLGPSVVRFGQALTRLHDLSFLSRERAASTFYDDLARELREVIPVDKVIVPQYVVPNVPRGSDYPVDFYVEGDRAPLYIFGVPGQDKARLATIVLQHLNRHHVGHRSLAVFQDMSGIGRADVSRLSNAADGTVDTLSARDDLRRKVASAMA